jgi:putative chitinase
MTAKEVQQFLKDNGYPAIVVDGDFGAKSKAFLSHWQSTNGLVADGIIGNATIAKMQPTPIVNSLAGAGNNMVNDASEPHDDKISRILLKLPNEVMNELSSILKTRKLSALQLSHFLSQVAHESGNFKFKSENLNYSADGLVNIFGKYFNSATAQSYARQPEKIANKVYANRMGNGNEASGDGWKHRGRGYIQLTGKDNYTEFDKTVDDDILANPDLVATKYPLASALFFFDKNNLWSLMKDASLPTQTIICKRVNGGTNGLEDRIKHFNEYFS